MDSRSKALLMGCLLVASPVFAQRPVVIPLVIPEISRPTPPSAGVNVTTGDVMAPKTGPARPLEVTNPKQAASLTKSGNELIEQLAQGTFILLPVAPTAPVLAAPSPEVQQRLARILRAATPTEVTADIDIVAQKVKAAAGAPGEVLIRRWVESLVGLQQNGKISPTQLAESIKTLNVLVNAVRIDFLRKPPIEFLTIQNLLSQLTQTLTS